MNVKTTIASASVLVMMITASPIAWPEPSSSTQTVTQFRKLIHRDGSPATDATLFVAIIDNNTHAVTTLSYKPDTNGIVTYPRDRALARKTTTVEYAQSPTGFGLWRNDTPRNVQTSILAPFTSVRIHLIDSQGKPIPHVQVCPDSLSSDIAGETWNEAIPGPWTQTTDSDGSATLAQLPQGCKLTLDVIDDNYVTPDERSAFQLADASTTPDTTVQIAPAGSISGTVLFGPTKSPVEGIPVRAFSEEIRHYSKPVLTNADGSYKINRLPAGPYSVFTFDVPHKFPDWTAQPHAVAVSAGASTTDTIITLVHGGEITGKITDRSTNKPVPDIFVSAVQQTDKKIFMTAMGFGVSDANGTYILHILPCKAKVAPNSFSSDFIGSRDQVVDIADGQTKTVNFHIKAPIPPNAVTGTVLDPDGLPIPNAEVTAIERRFVNETVTTDSHGRFTFETPGLKPNDSITARSRSLASPTAFIYKGESQITLRLAAGTLCTLKGLVKDQDGNPIPYAPLAQMDNTGVLPSSDLDYTQTDAQGRYIFPPTFGNTTYCIRVNTPHLVTYSARINAVAGQTIQVPVIIVKKADASRE